MKAPQLTRRRALALAGIAGVLAACGPESEEQSQAEAAEDDLATRMFTTLRSTTSLDELEAAIEEAGASGDQRFVSVLIEVLRAQEIGIFPGEGASAIRALTQLTGLPEQPWPDWVTWYATTDLAERDRIAQQIFDFASENVLIIGTVGYAPVPVIVHNRVGNIPRDARWFGDDTQFLRDVKPDQWFIRQ